MITSNAAAFAERFVRAAGEIQHGSAVGINAAALAYTTAIRANIAADTPKNLNRLSGVGRHGAAIGVGYRAATVAANPTALIRARGPLHLLENDTRAHSMTATRGARGRRNKSRRAVYSVGLGHPGTKGKHPFLHGVETATPAASALLGRSIIDSVTRVFA